MALLLALVALFGELPRRGSHASKAEGTVGAGAAGDTHVFLPLVLKGTPGDSETVRFAVIGDYGSGSEHEAAVAGLVNSWGPEFIITTGDNNYDTGSAATIDAHIGQFYHSYIGDYGGAYGEGAATNQFFPSLGNHDWYTSNAQPYLDYFNLPGNERYYRFTWGSVAFFAIDSDPNEPDGVADDLGAGGLVGGCPGEFDVLLEHRLLPSRPLLIGTSWLDSEHAMAI